MYNTNNAVDARVTSRNAYRRNRNNEEEPDELYTNEVTDQYDIGGEDDGLDGLDGHDGHDGHEEYVDDEIRDDADDSDTQPFYDRVDIIDYIIREFYPSDNHRSFSSDRHEMFLLECAKKQRDPMSYLETVFNNFTTSRLKRLGVKMNEDVDTSSAPLFDEKKTDKNEVIADLMRVLKNRYETATSHEEYVDADGESYTSTQGY